MSTQLQNRSVEGDREQLILHRAGTLNLTSHEHRRFLPRSPPPFGSMRPFPENLECSTDKHVGEQGSCAITHGVQKALERALRKSRRNALT